MANRSSSVPVPRIPDREPAQAALVAQARAVRPCGPANAVARILRAQELLVCVLPDLVQEPEQVSGLHLRQQAVLWVALPGPDSVMFREV